MKLKILMTLSILTLALLSGARVVNAQTNGTAVSTFLESQSGGLSGKEWKVVTITLSPGAIDSRSLRPGTGLVYVLEGGGVLQLDGKASLALQPGVAAVLNPEKPHILRNTSETEMLRVLVVVHDDRVNPGEKIAKKHSPRQGLGF